MVHVACSMSVRSDFCWSEEKVPSAFAYHCTAAHLGLCLNYWQVRVGKLLSTSWSSDFNLEIFCGLVNPKMQCSWFLSDQKNNVFKTAGLILGRFAASRPRIYLQPVLHGKNVVLYYKSSSCRNEAKTWFYPQRNCWAMYYTNDEMFLWASSGSIH